MNIKDSYIHNIIDKYIFVAISFFILLLYLLWYAVNITSISYRVIWFVIIPCSAIIAYVFSKEYSFSLINNLSKKDTISYVIFFLFLAATALYYIEPIVRYPNATIGIPNKDLHDGIAVYISRYGKPPVDIVNFSTSKFIVSSNDGLYLGYPNVLHTFSALLIQLGASPFHSTYISALIGIISTSLALFLLIKSVTKDSLIAAILASLFGLSSFRLPFGIVSSIPMFFSYTLFWPSILIVLIAIHQYKNHYSYILPAIAISVVAASYSGTIFILAGFIAIYAIFLLLFKNRQAILKILSSMKLSLPLLFLTMFFQHKIYWRNTFPTAADFDPYELAQRLMPLDRSIYMGILTISIITSVILLLKSKHASKYTPLQYSIFIVSFILILFIPYDLIFHHLHGVGEMALVQVDPNGFFGGLNHQKVARLALLQPFFFIFLFPFAFQRLRLKVIRYPALVLFLLSNMILRLDNLGYNPIQPELYSSFYNQSGQNKKYTLLSDLRLITNNQIWSKDIIEALNYLNRLPTDKIKVFLWDSREWTEETIANWGSLLLKQRIYRRKDIPSISITPLLLDFLQQNKYNYLLLIQPESAVLGQIKSHASWRSSYHSKGVYLYQINPVVLQQSQPLQQRL